MLSSNWVARYRQWAKSKVEISAELALDEFAKACQGQWPLTEVSEPFWRAFVIAVHLGKRTAFDRDELVARFVEDGLSHTQAQKLVERFWVDLNFLEECKEAKAYEETRP